MYNKGRNDREKNISLKEKIRAANDEGKMAYGKMAYGEKNVYMKYKRTWAVFSTASVQAPEIHYSSFIVSLCAHNGSVYNKKPKRETDFYEA